MVELFGISWDNGLRYNGGSFPWCGVSRPTAIAHLTFSGICLLLFLILFFFGWLIPVMLALGFIVFLITGIVIFILTCKS